MVYASGVTAVMSKVCCDFTQIPDSYAEVLLHLDSKYTIFYLNSNQMFFIYTQVSQHVSATWAIFR
jgi:hypothetical protein